MRAKAPLDVECRPSPGNCARMTRACRRWIACYFVEMDFRFDRLLLRLATRPARVPSILGQTHALALIGQRAPGLGDFQNGLPVILRDRISGQALAFGSPATVLGKDV